MQTDQSEIDLDEEPYLPTYQDVTTAVQAGEVEAGPRRNEGGRPRAGFDPAWDGRAHPVVTGEIGEPMRKRHEC
ncbi:MAG TPA: hypothetical protein VIM52_00645 [Stellaceae bacterium]|jgi:hypothetical protein